MRKAMYYSLDALLAGFLLVGVAVILLQLSFYEPQIVPESFITQDVLNILDELKISEFANNSFVQSEMLADNIRSSDLSILEQMGDYWAVNDTSKAITLFEIVFNDSLDDLDSINFLLENDSLYLKNESSLSSLVTSRRMVTGVSKGKAVTGSSASAYLKKVRNKKTKAFAFFGGFIGQGNISTFIDDLPTDLTPERVESIYLEGDFGDNFSLLINGEPCNSSGLLVNFTPTSPLGDIDSWDLTHCNQSIVSQRNNFSIIFYGDIENSYVAGGLLRLEYLTNTLQENISLGFDRYFFPEVIGVANIFDSFYIPGTLINMDVALHVNTEQVVTLGIGERVIQQNGSGSDEWIYFDNDYLLNNESFDYSQLSDNTIPLRFAAYNTTTQEVVSGNADIIVITDFSGSMKKAVDSWTQGTGLTDCDQLYTYPDARKTHLARCLDSEVANVVLNYSGNRLWPVFIHADAVDYYNNPEDLDAVDGYISTYGPQGKDKTCLACAINQAYDIFDTYGSENRTKFILLMTDGVPTHCADGSCTSTSVNFGSEVCEGFCDTNGASGCGGTMTGCDIDDFSCSAAEDNTIYSVNRTYNDLNVTFFTVGFGLIEDCDRANLLLNEIANMTNGTYQHSKNVSELRLIYQNISQEILTRVVQENQTVSVQGNITQSLIYGDSYINFTFDPIIQDPEPSKISLVFQEPLTSCTQVVEIPLGVDVVDASVISYSGTSWSDLLVVGNSTAFNMSDYYVPYYKLGDPLQIQLPVNLLAPGNNTLFVDTGISATNRSGCSNDNSFIYTGLINSSTLRSGTYEIVEGCNWTIESESGSFSMFSVPNDYSGSNECSYTLGNIAYNNQDAYDVATISLLRQLDPDNDGQVLVDLQSSDLEITITIVSGVPYLWGPSIASTHIWS